MADFAEAGSRLVHAFLESRKKRQALLYPGPRPPPLRPPSEAQVSAERLDSLASQVHLAEWSHSLLKEGPTAEFPSPVGTRPHPGARKIHLRAGWWFDSAD